MRNLKITTKDVKTMSYIDFMALLSETNRPPGGHDSIRKIAINTFLNKDSKILHIGCNTGSSTRLISSLTKSATLGIDTARSMIISARKITRNLGIYPMVKFKVGNAQKLAFSDNYFDLVFSAGSVAFMKDKRKAVNEAVRVIKPHGFLADIAMFYYKPPPKRLIEEMNTIMKINIQKWGKDFWYNLYNHPNLELFYSYEGSFEVPSEKKVTAYVKEMIGLANFVPEIIKPAEKRLLKIMNLFTENHKYLKYVILINQKVREREQIDLFGK